MPAFLKLTGEVYGRLTVLELAPKHGARTMWNCRCTCGVVRSFWAGNLRNGTTKSCGCLSVETTTARNTTHGLAPRGGEHPLYETWCNMKKRCNPNPNNPDAKDYYDRGIRVCERWQAFEAFVEDMGAGHRKGLTIERTDNDRGYEPGNCIWADYYVQANNKGNNRVVETPEGPLTTSQAAQRFNIDYQTLQARVHKGLVGDELLAPCARGWKPRSDMPRIRRFETPRGPMNMRQMCREFGISYQAFTKQLYRGQDYTRLLPWKIGA